MTNIAAAGFFRNIRDCAGAPVRQERCDGVPDPSWVGCVGRLLSSVKGQRVCDGKGPWITRPVSLVLDAVREDEFGEPAISFLAIT
jgi:hypothetical protein